MFFLVKNPFYKLTNLSDDLMKILIKDLPYIKKNKFIKTYLINKNCEYKRLIGENWKTSLYSFNQKELKKISQNFTVKFVMKKLKEFHELNGNKLLLSSGCIFLPDRCKYSFEINNQRYLYHKYHQDSGYKIKALISLVDSSDEDQQFSYIYKFPESKFTYFLKRLLFGQLVVFMHKIFYIVSFKRISLSGQPPELPFKYQDQSLYKKFNSLNKGDMITFHNLYPHSSHTGFSSHKSPMLQLVFDKC